jgi:hypothetical protein
MDSLNRRRLKINYWEYLIGPMAYLLGDKATNLHWAFSQVPLVDGTFLIGTSWEHDFHDVFLS